jgi:hypothetical protein
VGQKKRKASSGPEEAQGQQWARRSARPAVGQKKRKASSGPKEAQGQQWARRSARPAVGQKKRKTSTRRSPEDDPKNPRRRPEEGQKRGMPEGQQARSETCQKTSRPCPGDLTKESIETEKFQPLEQTNSNKVLGVSRC